MKKAIFLDRDGTLNRDEGYTYKIQDYELLPRVKDGLKKLQEAGYSLYILTSQSGIGRSMYDEPDYNKFMNHLLEDLRSESIEIAATYFCPHHPEKAKGDYKIDCECRKPKSGLLKNCEEDHGPFDYRQSWAIGDGLRDIEMAKNIDSAIRGILLPKNFETKSEKAIKDEDRKKVDFVASNFFEAVEIILGQ